VLRSVRAAVTVIVSRSITGEGVDCATAAEAQSRAGRLMAREARLLMKTPVVVDPDRSPECERVAWGLSI
jgi:hypothetical protein